MRAGKLEEYNRTKTLLQIISHEALVGEAGSMCWQAGVVFSVNIVQG